MAKPQPSQADFQNSYFRHDYSYGEAFITVNRASGAVVGLVTASQGKRFVIQTSAVTREHVWISLDPTKHQLVGDDTIPEAEEVNTPPKLTEEQIKEALQRAKDDRKTVAQISVKIYYTTEFKALTSDIPAFIENILTVTNQGFANSGIKIRLFLLCTEEYAGGEDKAGSASGELLNQFRFHKGPNDSVALDNADMAMLLADAVHPCGVANANNRRKPLNLFGLVTKGCALSQFGFGHEVGHILGLQHNAEKYATAPKNRFAFGYLIPGTDKRTIMAYRINVTSTGQLSHQTPINFYSSNKLRDAEGDRTGTGVADCVKVANARRFIYEIIGNESSECQVKNILYKARRNTVKMP